MYLQCPFLEGHVDTHQHIKLSQKRRSISERKTILEDWMKVSYQVEEHDIVGGWIAE